MSPVKVSRIPARVEKTPPLYESPVTNTVHASIRPSGDTRARSDSPTSGSVCVTRSERSSAAI
jgi:hypothetical protein